MARINQKQNDDHLEKAAAAPGIDIYDYAYIFTKIAPSILSFCTMAIISGAYFLKYDADRFSQLALILAGNAAIPAASNKATKSSFKK